MQVVKITRILIENVVYLSHYNKRARREYLMRAPYQILTILYKRENNRILYGIFYRNSHPIWQFISGGGENNEKPLETVIREIKEETSLIVEKRKIEQLDSKTTIPVLNITGEYTWGPNVYVVPEYSYAIEIKYEDGNIQLSN